MLKQALNRVNPRRVLAGIVERPRTVIGVIAAVSLMFALQIPRLSFQTSVYDLIIEDLPETAAYQRFKQVFGSDEIIRVVIRAENVFAPAAFEKITALAEAAAAIQGVRRVISLPGIKKDVDVSGNWTLDRFSAVVAPIDLFRNNIVSDDGRTTSLTLVLQDGADNDRVIQAVHTLMAEAGTGLSLYQIGMPLVSQALAQLTQRDFFRLPPLTVLLIAVLLLLLFRNVYGLALPLACVCLALVWTFGLMAISGIALSMLTMIVPVFLIAVGTAYCLHILSEYMACCKDAKTPEQAVLRTYGFVGFPTVLAVATTVIGLGSLMVNRIPTIREFALFSCFGMISLLVLVLTFLPAILCVLPVPRPQQRAQGPKPRWFDRIIGGIVHLNLNRQKVTLPLMAVFAIFCVAGILRIRVETNPLGYFKEDVPVYRHFHDIYQDLSGSFPINVTVAADTEDYFETPGHIQDLAKLQVFLETLPGVDKTVSFADYLKLVNYASNGFAPERYALPTESWELRMVMNNYKSLLGQDMFDRFMRADLSGANIVLLTHISSSRDFLETREKIRAFVRENFSRDLVWDVTGFGVVISASSRLLTNGQIKSLSITMVLVFGIMFILFLSVKVGFIAAATNLFPIVTVFGVMGWLGIELSMFTGLVASIAIGLAVDDTIHYLVRYNREFREDLDDRKALKATLEHVGRPIIFTTVTIAVGFSILVFSGFKATAVFGVLMVVTMVSALVGDMILLPSLMLHVELITLWDLVKLKLGTEPRHGIPLLQNMTRTEIHYICMAGALKQIGTNEVLFRKGDPSDSMYAVIAGKMDVVDHAVTPSAGGSPGFQKTLTTLKAGDVVGEMGLLRSVPRSATVIAREPGELLQINLKMIQRLQWLYPPTAHKFFFNLMTILCDRVERVSRCLYETSMVDDLTGLYNRKRFMEALEKEVNRAHRYPADLSLCLIRVSCNAVPSTGGFDPEAPVLLEMVRAMSGHLRQCDTLGRLDALTFALLLPQTDPARAVVILDRMQALMAARGLCASENGLKLKIGLAGLTSAGDETGQSLLQRALDNLEPDARISAPRPHTVKLM